eukprot:gnl/Spiro4/8203_TR4330_c0_g1_i1.p1 gnl/Spiro4/8203_TR4330_c0_g1~~gnl/Spiro4/8203_TR4330_c0_g1_i1.p1  ORF type:complete len:183 (+),score=11.56 gnl/Spiro4/8203_TR4330_c0_g1_i1:139-687(+)
MPKTAHPPPPLSQSAIQRLETEHKLTVFTKALRDSSPPTRCCFCKSRCWCCAFLHCLFCFMPDRKVANAPSTFLDYPLAVKEQELPHTTSPSALRLKRIPTSVLPPLVIPPRKCKNATAWLLHTQVTMELDMETHSRIVRPVNTPPSVSRPCTESSQRSIMSMFSQPKPPERNPETPKTTST